MGLATIPAVINGRQVEVPPGTTILQAAALIGVDIPTLCYLPGKPPLTSCFVCVVKVTNRDGRADIRPACATPITEPVEIDTRSADIEALRREAIELLLAYHLGDCLAPCQLACPLRCDIPTLLGLVRRHELGQAVRLLRQQAGLAHFLAHVCSSPCEKACRRAQWDDGLAIRSLCHALVHWQKDVAAPENTPAPPPQGRRVLIVGAGPTGLSAAWHLGLLGYEVVIREKASGPSAAWLQSQAGHSAGASPTAEPAWVALEQDLQIVLASGVKIRWNDPLLAEELPERLLCDWDAVLLACGTEAAKIAAAWGLAVEGQLVAVDKTSWQTSRAGIFAAGSAVYGKTSPLRRVADGKHAAWALASYLQQGKNTTAENKFVFRAGRLSKEELAVLAQVASSASRQEIALPASGESASWEATIEQLVNEADRCFRCACVAAGHCKLRQLAAQLGADPRRFAGHRLPLAQIDPHGPIVYEPRKCVLCGRCVAVAKETSTVAGLTFVGRGFETRVGTPFNQSFAQALGAAGEACVAVCPTGALYFHKEPPKVERPSSTVAAEAGHNSPGKTKNA
ncbi:MAG: 2Fe-2S iron-sulfur cluster-binding protein [Thermoguttaceae bacterium]|nr:2Fe-2S iron-sulfur cluster-binding protein [Thermoguttaceae bacterium]MDW8080060.1 2Fe-2S iron-sulfur cluster-binding protein [Thermoguttaceae bacterium]